MKTKEIESALLANGKARLVYSPKRKRKLRKRGEYVWWSWNYCAWLWEPKSQP